MKNPEGWLEGLKNVHLIEKRSFELCFKHKWPDLNFEINNSEDTETWMENFFHFSLSICSTKIKCRFLPIALLCDIFFSFSVAFRLKKMKEEELKLIIWKSLAKYGWMLGAIETLRRTAPVKSFCLPTHATWIYWKVSQGLHLAVHSEPLFCLCFPPISVLYHQIKNIIFKNWCIGILH